jgi:hypothetical protein
VLHCMNANILQKRKECVHNNKDHFWHILLIWPGFVCDFWCLVLLIALQTETHVGKVVAKSMLSR